MPALSRIHTTNRLLKVVCALILGAVLSAAPVPALSAPPAAPAPQADSALVGALHQGGYVIFLRHEITDVSQPDVEPADLANCSAQRNLSEEGRVQARQLGEALRTLAIPVGDVLSSEFCRTREVTAQLVFGRSAPNHNLNHYWLLETDAVRAQASEVLRQLLTTPPPAGTNTVLVSHGANLDGLLGLNLDTEGEMAIYLPDGQAAPNLVADVLPTEWIELASH